MLRKSSIVANRFVSIVQLLVRRLPYIFLWTLCVYGISWVIPKIYYSVMPGSWWINITEPVTATNARLGQPVTLKFCRDTRHDNIQAMAYRSFYRIDDGRNIPSGDYKFMATIEEASECQYVVMKPDKLPKEAGIYQTHTDLAFEIHGNRKVVSYDLVAPFTLSDTAESLQKQIEDVKAQLEELQRLQGVQTIDSSIQTEPTTSVTNNTAVIPPNLLVRQTTESTRPTTPPSSLPPLPPVVDESPIAVVPPEEGQPVSPQPIQGSVVSILQNATGPIRDLVRVVL